MAAVSDPSSEDSRLLSSSSMHSSPPHRSHSTGSFVSSPLNPSNPFSTRPASRASTLLHKLALDDPSSHPPPTLSTRGSMILYRFADDPTTPRENLLPPKFARDSLASSSGDSFISLSSDSKYPSGRPSPHGLLVPYAYDPALDELDPPDEEDFLHDPAGSDPKYSHNGSFPWRGLANVSVLLALITALLCLFIFYPVLGFFRNRERFDSIGGNIRINNTGQAPVLFQMPDLIDKETPDPAKQYTGSDGMEYELVFSDEFNTPGRTFYPGDDPFWEAADLWYGATADQEWYDPQQVTTRDGALVITMDWSGTTETGLTPNSTAPFTAAENHLLDFRSGMLQSWNKFCFTTGYVEVAVIFPGPDENTQGYWPGVWTMGNLARPGYPATTDGMWPYTYDSCDVGTFPNQTNPDGLGPPAALHSDFSRSKYNFELSWLSGQRLSACSCPTSEHPGPAYNKGRGAPEIDVFEAEKDKDFPTGQVVSQSAQFAPFAHDYVYGNDTADQWTIYDTSVTRANSYRGSAVQQAISGVSKTPSDMFQGTGRNFKTFGFEYWSDPNNRDDGYIWWQSAGQPSYRMGAKSVGPDQGPDGSGVSSRLIPEEPMSLVLNLGISSNWQPINLASMMFPSEFLIDYIRVYQRKGATNIGCDPKDYPTAQYIQDHIEAYQNPNMTTWNWPKPKNSLFEGGC